MRVTDPFGCRCPSSPPCSVSTPRSSNRTGGFTASGSPTRFAWQPTNHRPDWLFTDTLVPQGAAELLLEVIGNMATLLTLGPFPNALEVRPLPSTGITRLRRYYGPVRHPRRPGLSLAGFRLAHTCRHRWGFPCSVLLLCLRAAATAPVGPLGACIVRYPSDIGLPRNPGGSAPTLNVSRPAQRSLTLRPADSQSRLKRPFTPKALAVSLPPRPLGLLPARTIVAGRD